MARMLISGGNGFLGYHLVKSALAKGFEITVVDDLSTSKKKRLPAEVEFVRKGIETFNSEERYDYVVHLAARPSPEDYILNPTATILSNSIGTRNMLEIAKKNNSIFLYTSSSEVYGNAEIIPTPEDYFGYVNPNGIRSCYDESKRFSEALIMAYNREHHLDIKVERPFNIYGPGIRADGQYGRVIPRFILQALSGEPITVHGDGKQTRSFLYIDDWVDATWKFLNLKKDDIRVLNIGTNEEITILDLAELIKKMSKSSSKIVKLSERKEDPRRRSADISLAKESLGWVPKVKLEDGLRITIDLFR